MKQQQLTFEKGMTNVPSDAICSDNALEDSTNMIYRDGEHHVIQRPALSDDSATMKLVFVHKIGDGTVNKIYDNGTDLYCGSTKINNTGHSGSTLIGVTAIGKTMIVNIGTHIYYLLWKYVNSAYKYVKLQYPFPRLNFETQMATTLTGIYANSSSAFGNMIVWKDNEWKIGAGQQENYNNLVAGLYYKNVKQIAELKGFCKPFFIRAALELYDGTYAYITNPILLFPTVRKNSFSFTESEGSLLVMKTYYATLYFKQSTDYSDYSDIIKDVVVFASDGVNIYNTSGDQPLETHTYDTEQQSSAQDVDLIDFVANENIELDEEDSVYATFKVSEVCDAFLGRYITWLKCLKERSDNDITNDLVSTSVFYKLCSLGLNPINSMTSASEKIADYVLPNLTTQEQLQHDDFYSFSELTAGGFYTYNSRLNLFNVKRGLFSGFTYFMPWDSRDEYAPFNYTFYVRIQTNEKDVWVSTSETIRKQMQGFYFYYPDPRAKEVRIFRGNTCVCNQQLIEHPGLNGAYYLRGLPINNDEPYDTGTAPTAQNNFIESLPNTIVTSEVNNPFVYLASGYNNIGNGQVIGVAAQTQALSQGQFGQYPLLVFTTEGIWAMSLNNTGLFTAIHPMSREVALESNPAITPVDGAVFFVSKKGLMVVEGSKVQCMSGQLNGKGDVYNSKFFETCFIAYDYRDSLLWIFDGATHNNVFGSNECLVYNIKAGTYGKFNFGTYEYNGNTYPVIITNVVNDYPDYLLQDTRHHVFTLMGRPDVNHDGVTNNNTFIPNVYSATLVSRPMKLENGLALKRIIQMKHIKNMDDTYTTTSGTPPVTTTHPTLVFSMEGSNNAKDWCQLTSLRSIPWKYYRFAYTFEHLKATDTFAGTVIVTEEVRTNKLR